MARALLATAAQLSREFGTVHELDRAELVGRRPA
jgi:hypothetical protein